MNLYLLRQDVNNNYDTYDSAVVAAKTVDEARAIHPDGTEYGWGEFGCSSWAKHPNEVKVKKIGVTTTESVGVILSSFNAG